MIKKILWIVLVGLLFSSCAIAVPVPIVDRPGTWAQSMTVAGLPNLFRVSAPPARWTVYRSALPLAEGFSKGLVELGITTDINLYAGHPDKALLPKGIEETYIPAHTWHPEFEDAVAVLKAIKIAPGPVLIHCQHGSDRTGWSVALFRIVFENWTKEQAVDEMLHGGFGFHWLWGNLAGWIRGADIPKLKKAVGL